jgi:hypothetical protein
VRERLHRASIQRQSQVWGCYGYRAFGWGPSSRAPGVYRCTQAAWNLATETTLCERRYIKPRWRPISQILRASCFARRSLAPWPRAQRPAVDGGCFHAFCSDKSPAAGVVRNTSPHMAAVAQALNQRLPGMRRDSKSSKLNRTLNTKAASACSSHTVCKKLSTVPGSANSQRTPRMLYRMQ